MCCKYTFIKLKEVESLRNNRPTVTKHFKLILHVVHGSGMGTAKDVQVDEMR